MSNVLPGRVVPCVHWYTSACSSIVISPPPKYVTCWFYKRPFTLLHEPLHWCKSEWPSPTLLLQFAWVFVLMPRWQNSAGLSLAQSASVKWTLNRVIILGSSSPGKTNVCTRMIRNRPGYFAHARSVSIRPLQEGGAWWSSSVGRAEQREMTYSKCTRAIPRPFHSSVLKKQSKDTKWSLSRCAPGGAVNHHALVRITWNYFQSTSFQQRSQRCKAGCCCNLSRDPQQGRAN